MYLYVLIYCSFLLHSHGLWVVRLSSRAGGGCSVTCCRVLGTMDGTGIHTCMALFLMHCIFQTWELKAFLKDFIKAIEHQLHFYSAIFYSSKFLLTFPSSYNTVFYTTMSVTVGYFRIYLPFKHEGNPATWHFSVRIFPSRNSSAIYPHDTSKVNAQDMTLHKKELQQLITTNYL